MPCPLVPERKNDLRLLKSMLLEYILSPWKFHENIDFLLADGVGLRHKCTIPDSPTPKVFSFYLILGLHPPVSLMFKYEGQTSQTLLFWEGVYSHPTPLCFDAPGGREAFLPVEHMLPRTEASTNAVRATVPRLVVLLMDTSWWLPVVD